MLFGLPNPTLETYHDDVIKWKHSPRYWPFVWGMHRSPVNSPHKGQWRGALMFSLICVWINGWLNHREASDLRRYRPHYDASVMIISTHLCYGRNMMQFHGSILNVLSFLESLRIVSYMLICFSPPGVNVAIIAIITNSMVIGDYIVVNAGFYFKHIYYHYSHYHSRNSDFIAITILLLLF